MPAEVYPAPRALDAGKGPRVDALARLKERALVAVEPYVTPGEPGFLVQLDATAWERVSGPSDASRLAALE